MRRRRISGLGVLVAALSVPIVLSQSPVARAQPAGDAIDPEEAEAAKQRAKAHLERGRKAYQEGRFKDAVDAFLDAHREVPSPELSFNAALAYERLGDRAGALRFFREYLRQDPNASDRARVAARISDLESKLRERGVQQVTILSEPPGATIFVDGRPIGVTPWTGELYPGRHALRLRREGHPDAKQTFELPAHRAIDVSVVLEAETAEPAAPAPPSPVSVPETSPAPAPEPRADEARSVGLWTWAAFGVGAAALGGALVFEISRASAEEDVKTERTRVARLEANDRMEERQTTARILLGVGGAAMLVGGVLLYFDLSGSSSEEKPVGTTTRGFVGCTSAFCGGGLGGRF